MNNGRGDNGGRCDGSETCDAVSDCQASIAVNVADDVCCTYVSCVVLNDLFFKALNDVLCDNFSFCDCSLICFSVSFFPFVSSRRLSYEALLGHVFLLLFF